ncbi:MAG: hypothetical protein KKH41_04595 [Candidatus Thermoplasmatota archaeon]|nr:hypothetical protein [Euryarchaeota archaeon]MBU4144038.1 hypothetical protein [Candidatus Thermoplasmatota archaeon]MBU4591848.1 hypothetical protein [Candidatus Thermoplasmatota archaeon]
MGYITKVKTRQMLFFTLFSIIIIFLSNWAVLIYTPRTVRDVILLSLFLSLILIFPLYAAYYMSLSVCDLIIKKENIRGKDGEGIKLEPYVINITIAGLITSFNYANALLFTDKLIPILCIILISFFSIYGCLIVIDKCIGESTTEGSDAKHPLLQEIEDRL